MLIVEDENVVLDTMMGYFDEFCSAKVDIARDGQEAINQCAIRARPQNCCGPYRLILMDLGLPGISGFEATGQIRNLPGFEKTTVIAFTALMEKNVKHKIKVAGFDKVLYKPIDTASTINLLKDHNIFKGKEF